MDHVIRRDEEDEARVIFGALRLMSDNSKHGFARYLEGYADGLADAKRTIQSQKEKETA